MPPEKRDWFVEITLDTVPADEQIRRVNEYMDYLGTEASDAYTRFGTYIGAVSIRQAVNDGLDRSIILLREEDERLTNHIVGVQAMNEPLRLDLLAARRNIPDIVGVGEIQEILKINSRQQVSQMADRPTFPQPVTKLKAGNIWLRKEIVTFGQTWNRRPGRS